VYRALAFLVAIAATGAFSEVWGQSAADTLPDRVIDRAYAAFHRHDPEAFLSNFAETWWYSPLEDTAAAPPPGGGPLRRRSSEQGRDSVLRLDIFEVRNGKIVREWESGGLPSRP
jgi:hypothetical protein